MLAAKGFIPAAWLDDLGARGSPLGHHPDRMLIPASRSAPAPSGTGSGSPSEQPGLRAGGYTEARTFVLLGDAELDEGSNHEAITYAPAIRLPITAIVIDNHFATHGWPGGIPARFSGASRDQPLRHLA